MHYEMQQNFLFYIEYKIHHLSEYSKEFHFIMTYGKDDLHYIIMVLHYSKHKKLMSIVEIFILIALYIYHICMSNFYIDIL